MIAEARTHVASALTAGSVPCQPYPPDTIVPPAALLYPGDPYTEPTQLHATTVGLQLRLVAAPGQHSARILDTHIDAALAALHTAGIVAGPTPAPAVDSQGPGYLYVDIPITVHWED